MDEEKKKKHETDQEYSKGIKNQILQNEDVKKQTKLEMAHLTEKNNELIAKKLAIVEQFKNEKLAVR